ncbi:hypothetical protein ONS96_000481 [Cadophora gregata f. sp. sojae]|nr:hypothetical protein ONS96_000481 [Cadophora gregata f. sp. sojae]
MTRHTTFANSTSCNDMCISNNHGHCRHHSPPCCQQQLCTAKDKSSTTITTHSTIVKTSSNAVLQIIVNPRLTNNTFTVNNSSINTEPLGPKSLATSAVNTEQPLCT